MSGDDLTDDILMAFADGELDNATAARVVEAISRDPTVAERIDVFRRSRQALQDAFVSIADDPVPSHLIAAIRDASSEPPRPSLTARLQGWLAALQRFFGDLIARPLPAAALGAAVIGVPIGFGVSVGFWSPEPSAVAWVERPEVRSALDSAAAGSVVPLGSNLGELHVVGSFRVTGGTLCREVEMAVKTERKAAIVCVEAGQWQDRFSVVVNGSSAGFVPASGAASLETFLTGVGAGPYLDPESEAAALAAHQG